MTIDTKQIRQHAVEAINGTRQMIGDHQQTISMCDEIDTLRAQLVEAHAAVAEVTEKAQRNADGRRYMINLLDAEVGVRIAATARAEKAEAQIAALRAVLSPIVTKSCRPGCSREGETSAGNAALDRVFDAAEALLVDTDAVAARYFSEDEVRVAVAGGGLNAPVVVDNFIAGLKARRGGA